MSTGGARRHRYQALALAGVAALTMGLGTGTANAAIDSYSTIEDGAGDQLEIMLGDTFIQGVPPLDSSPLSREFFHSGYTEARISGPTAGSLTDSTLTFGYQIGYPIALTGATLQLNTPGIGWELESTNGIDLIGFLPGGDDPDVVLGTENRAMLAGDIIPQQNLTVNLAPGGITDVPIIDGKSFSGPGAKIRIGNIHGSVAGVLGQVTLRPYAKLQLASGDVVMTYGAPVPI